MKASRLIWYANRLRAMSAAELFHRIKERRLRRLGRSLNLTLFDAETFSDIGALGFDISHFDVIAQETLPEWRCQLNRAQSDKWHFLGMDWPQVRLDRLWHLDPSSGLDWPAQSYCFDVNYRHQDRFGDIKHVWEVNRLQILPIAAAVARAEGDPAAREFTLAVIESWIRANPPFKGVNWCSGIELAIRAVNIVAALALLGPQTVPVPLRKALAGSLAAHRFWLARFPSRFSSANNHRVAELGGLYILGRALPELTGAKADADAAWMDLQAEILLQLHPDGVGAEQSPTYTSFTLEWFALALAVARETGDRIGEAERARLSAAGEVLQFMSDQAGNLPRIGDDDEGRVLLSGPAREVDYPALVLSSLSSLLERPDLAPRHDRAHLRQVWLGRATAPAAPSNGVRHFDSGGYSVLRSTFAGRESVLVFDHGPLGFLSIAAHGHADALALWWHLDEQPVLIDAGTYLYHAGGTIRNRFRGTAVHNTLCLAGCDQSTISGAFNWSRKARAWRVECAAGLEGIQNGYVPQGSEHHRRVVQLQNGFEVHDWLVGAPFDGSSEARLQWLLAPNLAVKLQDGKALIWQGRDLLVTVKAVLIEDATCAQTLLDLALAPCEFSPDFGRKSSTMSLSLTTLARDLIDRRIITRFFVHALEGRHDERA